MHVDRRCMNCKNGTSRSAEYAATATANTGRISGWRMTGARNGRKTMYDSFIEIWEG